MLSITKENKHYSKLELFIRSFIFSTYSLSTMVIYSFFCLFSLLLPFKKRQSMIRAYLVVYFKVLKAVCHIDYKVEGFEHLRKNRPGIIMSKHQSTWETFFLPLIFHDPAIIIKRQLLLIPFFGWGLAISDPIAINRSNKSSAMQQIIAKGKRALAANRSILIFPEGTRVAPGHIGYYRLGGARLAAATGAPIIPVAHNAGRAWPRRKFIKQPGTITMVIGPLIESEGKTAEALLAETKDWIETTMLRIDKEWLARD